MYVNGLRMEIQEEISMISPRTVEEAYQCALGAEEKLVRKQNFQRGRSLDRRRGQAAGRRIFVSHRSESINSNQLNGEMQNFKKNLRAYGPQLIVVLLIILMAYQKIMPKIMTTSSNISIVKNQHFRLFHSKFDKSIQSTLKICLY